MKIAMCASEVFPFAKTGGLADVAGALPLALENLGEDVIVVMPGYKSAHKNKDFPLKNFKEGVSYSTIGKNVTVYFIEEAKYFNREGLYGNKSGDYPDNLERFSYFCRKTLELLKDIEFNPDIIHCHDWQACLIPVFLKTVYAGDTFFKNAKVLLTIHNIGYQGLFPREQYPKLGIDWKYFNLDGLEFYGDINLLKGGIIFSDLINTVSHTYSREIQTREFGFGLEGLLHKRKDSVFGIINGLDYSIWDPATDNFIARKFSLKNIEDKAENKRHLQQFCGLPVNKNIPVIGIVSRLAEQKGFDVITEAMDSICKMDVQLIILGTGDLKYHLFLEGKSKKYPQIISLNLKFDEALAHKIYAGSDIFLMPSKYEPCGLGQLIALKYGALPVVYKTGGLADTVDSDNGFVFDKYNKDELIRVIKKAVALFKNNAKWNVLMQQAMKCNFSWDESAKKYMELYEKKAAK